MCEVHIGGKHVVSLQYYTRITCIKLVLPADADDQNRHLGEIIDLGR